MNEINNIDINFEIKLIEIEMSDKECLKVRQREYMFKR